MTPDRTVNIRNELTAALAVADGADLACPTHGSRYRQLYTDRAFTLLGRTTLPAGTTPEVRRIVEEYHAHHAVLAGEKDEHRRRNAAMIEAAMEAKRPEPDHDHRVVTILAENGRRYRVRFPVHMLEVIGNDEDENALEARGLPFVRRATSAA